MQDENYARRGNTRCQSFKIKNSLKKKLLPLRQPCLKIVDMVELLGEVDTTGVAPTTTMADRKGPYSALMWPKKGTEP